jgi:hypothetical protein
MRDDTLIHASNLRREYFEEVPETAEFLQRSEELDSLLADRPLGTRNRSSGGSVKLRVHNLAILSLIYATKH